MTSELTYEIEAPLFTRAGLGTIDLWCKRALRQILSKNSVSFSKTRQHVQARRIFRTKPAAVLRRKACPTRKVSLAARVRSTTFQTHHQKESLRGQPRKSSRRKTPEGCPHHYRAITKNQPPQQRRPIQRMSGVACLSCAWQTVGVTAGPRLFGTL